MTKENRRRANVYTVKFHSKRHREVFASALQMAGRSDQYLASALYLLTADANVWKTMKFRVKNGEINFEQVKFITINEKGYILYTAAKDLYLGTEHLCIADLADEEMIRSRAYELICCGMLLRRGEVQIPKEMILPKEENR